MFLLIWIRSEVQKAPLGGPRNFTSRRADHYGYRRLLWQYHGCDIPPKFITSVGRDSVYQELVSITRRLQVQCWGGILAELFHQKSMAW